MVSRETCNHCKGNKYVRVPTERGRDKHVPCPQCGGNGFKVRISLSSNSQR